MGEETTRLRQEIEQTRENLTRDVDQLADKTSPSRIVERRVERTRQGIVGLRDKVMGSRPGRHTDVGLADPYYGNGSYGDRGNGDTGRSLDVSPSHLRDQAREQAEGNPLAAGLLAFGVGWLVSSLLPASEAEKAVSQQVADIARDHGAVEQLGQAAKDIGQNLQGSAQEKVAQVQETARGAVENVKQEASDAAVTAKDDVREAATNGRR